MLLNTENLKNKKGVIFCFNWLERNDINKNIRLNIPKTVDCPWHQVFIVKKSIGFFILLKKPIYFSIRIKTKTKNNPIRSWRSTRCGEPKRCKILDSFAELLITIGKRTLIAHLKKKKKKKERFGNKTRLKI